MSLINPEPEQIKRESFSTFASRMKRSGRVSTSADAYSSFGGGKTGNVHYDVEQIRQIVKTGTRSQLESLSAHFYRSSGIYAHTIDYLAHLLTYDTIIIPKMEDTGKLNKKVALKKFVAACEFIDILQVPVVFAHITKMVITHGSYFGLLREFSAKAFVVQELDRAYCRSYYKSENGVDILEFDVGYFDTITDQVKRELALKDYPPEFKKAYNKYKNDRNARWLEVAEEQGVVFYTTDMIPYLIASLPTCLMYDEAQDDERKRDRQELEKLLIIEMPIKNDGEPVFDLDETVSIHEGVSAMLSTADYINVLTTFGSSRLEDAQDATQASRDKLAQYKRAAYDAIGTSSALFNAEGNVALEYSVNRDTANMLKFAERYAGWLTFQINRRHANSKIAFDVEILPLTIYNRKEMAGLYLQGAQFGYSKMYAGAALGIKQSNLVKVVDFENDILDLTNKLVPLQSSHTQSLKKDGEKSGVKTDTGDMSNGGAGRPELPSETQDDKTIQNKGSGG